MTHGLQGMSTRAMGPSRQVADKGYYLLELRQRVQEVNSEVETIVKEIEQIEQDNNLQVQLSRKYDNLLREVREREGELADFNLALDKVRTHTEASDLREMFIRLQERNEHERTNVDEAFLRAANIEKTIRDMEETAEQAYQEISTRIGKDLGADAEREYGELLEEEKLLSEENKERERLLGDIDLRIDIAQSDLNSEAYRVHARGLELKRTHAQLSREKAVIEEELSEEQTGEQLKDRLLKQIKDANGEIAELEMKIREMEKTISRLHGEVEAKENDIHSAKNNRVQAGKYEALAQKDRQMDEFIAQFPEAMSEEVAQREQLQMGIVTLLKHISQHVVLKESLPDDEGKLDQLKSELSFQQMSQAQAQQTLAEVKAELARRKDELVKIQGLDKRVGEELKELRDKMEEMKQEMTTFKPADDVRKEHADAKEKLSELLAQAKTSREAMRVAVQLAASEHEALERRVKGHAQLKTLTALEKKLQVIRQQNATLSDYIDQRKRESDYEEAKEACKELVTSLNNMHVELARML